MPTFSAAAGGIGKYIKTTACDVIFLPPISGSGF
jgi:hypothetical protein